MAGRGGITATARATGISVPTIRKGIAELQAGERLEPGRVRRPGGGRKPLTEVDRTLLEDLERLVDADSRGDPESLLRWTSKSVRHLAEGLRELGHQAHFTTVAQLLRGLGYSLQANVKTREGRQHPDRDAQFRHINAVAKRGGRARPAGDQRRHQEEGAGRRFQERRPRVAAQGRAGAGPRPRLQGQAARQGDPLRRLRPRAPTRGGSTSGSTTTPPSSRSNSIRSWWEHLGQPRYPNATTAADHRRLRRLQRQPHEAVEGRAAEARRRDRASRSPSATSRPAPRSGTGSSTACSASSR